MIGSRNIGCANDVITLQIEIDLSGTFASADAYFQKYFVEYPVSPILLIDIVQNIPFLSS